MKFIITVDTEADNQWARSRDITLENIKYLPRFQELCQQYGFKPSYMATYEMAESPDFSETIGHYIESGSAEIGAHLHPWTNPPFEAITTDDFLYHPYPHELPLSLFKAKMENLTAVLERAFNKRPRTYRAGRWGFAPEHNAVLLDLGYVADCSVTPGLSWERHLGNPKGKGGPDFRKAPIHPYYLDPDDARKPGNSGLLEVPPTILFTKFSRAKKIFLAMDKFITGRWALRKFGFGPKQLRTIPPFNSGQLITICETATKLRLPYVQMMIHSSELMPGGSPYNPDEKSIEYLYSQLEKLFEHLKDNQVRGETLLDYATSLISFESSPLA